MKERKKDRNKQTENRRIRTYTIKWGSHSSEREREREIVTEREKGRERVRE